MAFTINLTDTTAIDDSKKLAFEQAFITASEQTNVLDAFASKRSNIGAVSIQFPKYAQLNAGLGALTETEDATSTALSDEKIILTPEERGNVITLTNLASLQSGGLIDLAAPTIVGQDMSTVRNKLAGLALDASTNVLTANGGAVADIAATDVLSGTVLNKAYNKLARASIATVGGSYVLVAHDDVIADLRAATGDGSWTDVSKYATPGTVLANEVGMYKGFRVIRNNHATVTADAGAGAVDVYNSYVLGFNALGYAESQTPQLRLTQGADKLGRFYHLGWYGVFAYGIVDKPAAWVIKSASSLGANA